MGSSRVMTSDICWKSEKLPARHSTLRTTVMSSGEPGSAGHVRPEDHTKGATGRWFGNRTTFANTSGRDPTKSSSKKLNTRYGVLAVASCIAALLRTHVMPFPKKDHLRVRTCLRTSPQSAMCYKIPKIMYSIIPKKQSLMVKPITQKHQCLNPQVLNHPMIQRQAVKPIQYHSLTKSQKTSHQKVLKTINRKFPPKKYRRQSRRPTRTCLPDQPRGRKCPALTCKEAKNLAWRCEVEVPLDQQLNPKVLNEEETWILLATSSKKQRSEVKLSQLTKDEIKSLKRQKSQRSKIGWKQEQSVPSCETKSQRNKSYDADGYWHGNLYIPQILGRVKIHRPKHTNQKLG